MGSPSSSRPTRVVDLRENEEMPSSSRSVRVIDRRDEEEEEEQTTILYENISKPRRSGRTIRLPRRYKTNVIVSNTNDDDPASFKEAMVSSDKDKQQKAMDQEMESMNSNFVWTFIDTPEDVKVIRYKWIYKKKIGVDGQVKTYKA